MNLAPVLVLLAELVFLCLCLAVALTLLRLLLHSFRERSQSPTPNSDACAVVLRSSDESLLAAVEAIRVARNIAHLGTEDTSHLADPVLAHNLVQVHKQLIEAIEDRGLHLCCHHGYRDLAIANGLEDLFRATTHPDPTETAERRTDAQPS